MKYIHIVILVVLFSVHSTQSQSKTHLSKAVNIAGKQRMLGQRLAKNKAFIKAHQKKDIAQAELEQTIIDFENGLKTLAEFAPTDKIKHKVALEAYVYKQYKRDIEDKSKTALKEIIDTNTLFLNVCDDVVTALIEYSKTIPDVNLSTEKRHKSYLIDRISEATGASGKLRYLTQRLTLYFSINEFGFQTVSTQELGQIIDDIDHNLSYLTVLEFNTIDIDDSLALVHFYWDQLKFNLYDKSGNLTMTPEKINADLLYDLCNNILDKANTTTKMYADLNKI